MPSQHHHWKQQARNQKDEHDSCSPSPPGHLVPGLPLLGGWRLTDHFKGLPLITFSSALATPSQCHALPSPSKLL